MRLGESLEESGEDGSVEFSDTSQRENDDDDDDDIQGCYSHVIH